MKTKMSYHFTCIRTGKIINNIKKTMISVDKDTEKLEPLYIVVGAG